MIECGIFYDAKFIGHEHCKLKKGEMYSIKIDDNPPYGKLMTILGNDDYSDICPYGAMKSIERFWKINV